MTAARLGRITRRIWLGALLAALGIGLVLMFISLVAGEPLRNDVLSRALAVVAVVPVMSVLGVMAAIALGRGGLTDFMLAAMLALAAGTVAWMVLVWRLAGWGEAESVLLVKTCVSLTLVGGGLAIFGFLATSPRRAPPLVAVRWVLLGSGLVASAAALLMMWSSWWHRHLEILAVAVGAGTAVAVLAGAISVVLTRVEAARAKRIGDSVPRRVSFSLACPRCEHEQVLSAGPGRCANCGVAILIEVEEPRCACGYLLYRLEGDTCPECGREVDPAARWVAAGVGR